MLTLRRRQEAQTPSVYTAATVFEKMCYDNKDALSAGIIVAGWDKEVGPSVYNIPLGGGLFRQPWAIGGSGSTYVYGYCDATYQEGWGKEQTVQFVKNSTFSLHCVCRIQLTKHPVVKHYRWQCRGMAHLVELSAWPLSQRMVSKGSSSQEMNFLPSGKDTTYLVPRKPFLLPWL